MYAVLFLLLVAAMRIGGQHKFAFIADKMKPKCVRAPCLCQCWPCSCFIHFYACRYFWWEVVLLVRKLVIMAVALRTSDVPARGWFICSFVLTVCISLHTYARPYDDDFLNACEYISLISTMVRHVALRCGVKTCIHLCCCRCCSKLGSCSASTAHTWMTKGETTWRMR
jgi:hypothetical protein